MHRLGYLATVCLAGLALTAPIADARTLRPGDGIRMAERAVPSKCTGRMTIIETTVMDTPSSWGEASGMVFDHDTGVWRTERCEVRIVPGLSPVERCTTEIHEYLHIALEQAEHTGMLDPKGLASVSSVLCDPPLSDREQLFEMIRERLPRPASWTIRCSKNSRKMSCRALRAGSRTRRYRASMAGGVVQLWQR